MLYQGFHAISPDASSTAANSTVEVSTFRIFNSLPFQPLSNSTTANSTYLIERQIFQFSQDVEKQLKLRQAIWLTSFS